ncbi:TPA: hypothetical protein ACQRHL_000489 [Pseudomonas aeruginosa]|uniref:hypothetical protein n=1 Tax=Pseudomonas aeruginosa TaxID=287 RepID=UPI00070A0F3D|nr:hypothetical protein [Pseudomonas aeruginosa]
MKNEILTSVQSYFMFMQKSDASLALLENMIMHENSNRAVSVILEILKEINQIENYATNTDLYIEYESFAKTFIRHLEKLLINSYDDFDVSSEFDFE